MKIQLCYEEALLRHPKQVAEIVGRIRKGKSKFRNAPAMDLRWEYDIAVAIHGYSFSEVLGGKAAVDTKAEDAMSIEEWVDDRKKNVRTLLAVSMGNCWHGVDLPGYCPPEMVERYRKHRVEELAERARFDALPKTLQEAEIRENLRKLSGGRGFSAIRVSR